jgi:hypothetical protein
MATHSSMTPEELAEHTRTFHWVARGVLLAGIHAVVILAVLGWVFSGDMG